MIEVYQTLIAPILEIGFNGQKTEMFIDQTGRGVPGVDGRSIEMQQIDGLVQWRNVGASEWNNLFDLSTIVITSDTDIRPVLSSRNATADDVNYLLLLDGTTEAVTLTINPALWPKKQVRIRCIDITNEVKIAVSTGVIESESGSDVTELNMLRRQTFEVYSDGLKLIILKS